MEISVQINSCHNCRHNGHSGAFTKGGAKPVCRGPRASHHATKGKNIKEDNKYHYEHRVLPYKTVDLGRPRGICHQLTKEIPEWCPLKNGEKY